MKPPIGSFGERRQEARPTPDGGDIRAQRTADQVRLPPQELPAPAVHPKQCLPVAMRRSANLAGAKSSIRTGAPVSSEMGMSSI